MSRLPQTPYDAVYLGIGGIAWVVATLKLRAWRRGPSQGLLVVALTVASPATSFVLAAPVVYRAVDRLSGCGNLATLLVYLGITGFSAAAVVLARIWDPPGRRPGTRTRWTAVRPDGRPVRVRLVVFGVLAAAMTVLFLAGGPYRPETPLTFDTAFAPHLVVAAFLVVYQAVFGFALTDIGRVCLGHARWLPAGALRRGIRLIAAGSLTACGYVLCKTVAVAASAAGVAGAEWLSTAAGPVFAVAGAVLITAGFTLPALAAFTRRRRDFRALRPLWDLVHGADRRLALEEPWSPWTERFAVRDLEWRAARRGLEIRDGQLTLRPWVDPDVVAAAGRLAGRERLATGEHDALVVAAALRSAVAALNAGRPPRPREEQPHLPGMDTEPAEERGHLVRVAQRLNEPLTDEALAVVVPR